MAAGLTIQGLHGFDPLMQGVLGAAVALGAGIILFALGVLGAGDGKLLAVEGAFLGLSRLGTAALAAAIAGGVLAVIMAARAGRLGRTFARTGNGLLYLVTFGRFGAMPKPTDDNALTVPYGVAIAAGAVWAWMEGLLG